MSEIQNPLLAPFDLKDQAVPFHLIKTEHFLPALKIAISEAQTKLAQLKNEKVVTFENTILGLEQLSETVDRVSGLYFNLFSAEANDELQKLAQEISPLLSALSSDISLDSEVFQKIKFVYDNRQNLNLKNEDLRLTEKMYTDFVRNGALLPSDKKEQLRQLDQELSVLSPQFSENVLKATNEFELWITDAKDLAGLPDGAIEAAAMSAEQKNKKGQWLFTLHGPSLIPFMTYCSNRSLREKMWRASSSKAFGGKYDNQEIILKIVRLKHQRAQLLGFKNYAEYVLEERMAKNSQTVFAFIEKLLEPSKKAALKDLNEVREFRKEIEGNDEISLGILLTILKNSKKKNMLSTKKNFARILN